MPPATWTSSLPPIAATTIRPLALTVNVPRVVEPSLTVTVRAWLPAGLITIVSSAVVPTTIRLPRFVRWAVPGLIEILASLTATASAAASWLIVTVIGLWYEGGSASQKVLPKSPGSPSPTAYVWLPVTVKTPAGEGDGAGARGVPSPQSIRAE